MNNETVFLLVGARAANDNVRTLGTFGCASSATVSATRVDERQNRAE